MMTRLPLIASGAIALGFLSLGIPSRILNPAQVQGESKIPSSSKPKLDTSITLVTSFWAEPASNDNPPKFHRLEIEAALIANLANPFLSQIVVILDGSSPETNCSHFQQRMNELYHQHVPPVTGNDTTTELTCLPHDKQGQPSYYDMFQYAINHEAVKGRVVMLANADHVFDETLWRAQYVKPNTLLTLATRGFQTDSNAYVYIGQAPQPADLESAIVPNRIRQFYLRILNKKDEETKHPGVTPDWCQNRGTPSWDTYIFDKQSLQAKLNNVTDPKSLFYRPHDGHYVMNLMAAENAALADLARALGVLEHWKHFPSQDDYRPYPLKQPPTEFHIWNACKWIHSYHFHFAPKMHKNKKRVAKPHAFAHLMPSQNVSGSFYNSG